MKRVSLTVFAAVLSGCVLAVPSASATQPGRNGDIVFAQYVEQPCNSESRVMAIRPSGKKIRTLSRGFEDVLRGSFGPDQIQIQRIDDVGCRTFDGSDPDLGRFEMNVANGALSALPASVLGPVSPDQQWQAFERYSPGTAKPDLVVSHLDGSDERVFPLDFLPTGSQGLSQAYALEWSPAGKRLLFVAGGVEVDEYPPGSPVDQQLYSLSVDDRKITRLTSGPLTFGGTWSPDGREVVFNKKGRIATISALGGKPRFLTPKSVRAGTPTWSPSGKQIAFVVVSPKNAQDLRLRVMRRDGERSKTIAKLGSAQEKLLWMPR